MKSFRFRLEKVLRFRQMREDLLKLELAESQRRLGADEVELNRLIGAKSEVERQLTELQTSGFNPQEAQMYLGYISGLGNRIAMQNDLVRKSRARVSDKQKDLLAASLEKKKLKRLKEKAYQEHLADAARAEQAFLDETNTTRSTRSRRMAGQEVSR